MKFKVWEPGHGSEEQAGEFEVKFDAAEAVEEYVHGWDNEGIECAINAPQEVHARGEDGRLRKFKVRAEAVVDFDVDEVA